jgi:putative membrane protein
MTEISSPARFDSPPTVSNHFAWLRTRLGMERTFMAWIRTAASLIGFGFTIVQFFQRLQETTSSSHVMRPEAPRDLGLALIATGVGALVVSSWQYRLLQHYMWGDEFKAIAGVGRRMPHHTPAFGAAMVLILIGVFAFFTVFFHVM